MTDREALIEFLKGAGSVLAVLGTFAFIVGTVSLNSEPREKFKVVDHYGGDCSVVRYTPPNRSDYVYFLDCTSAHLRN